MTKFRAVDADQSRTLAAFYHRTRKQWVEMTADDVRRKDPEASLKALCSTGLIVATVEQGLKIYSVTDMGRAAARF